MTDHNHILKGKGIEKLILLFSIISLCDTSSCPADPKPWGYQPSNGPSLWCSLEEKCCGKRQSPIHINTTNVQIVPDLPPISFQDYETAKDFKIIVSNVGITVAFHPEIEGGVVINGGCAIGKYVLDQFHFHWSSSDKQGSEHVVDNMVFPLEMHIVHRNVLYNTVPEARKHDDGLTFITVLFEVNKDIVNSAYDLLADQLELVSYKNTKHEFQFPGTLKSLLPANTDDFFCYPGSINSPQCEEVVTWYIFKDHVVISPKFLERLRTLHRDTNDVDMLVNNIRHVQPLNGRDVKARLISHK